MAIFLFKEDIMKVKMRKWYSFLIALFAVMMLFTPITCKAEEKTTFDSVEEAKEYISQQEDIAGSAGDNIPATLGLRHGLTCPR